MSEGENVVLRFELREGGPDAGPDSGRGRSGQVGVETRSRVPPRLRDTLTRATAVAGHAHAWILDSAGGIGRDTWFLNSYRKLVINDLSFILVYSGNYCRHSGINRYIFWCDKHRKYRNHLGDVGSNGGSR